MHADEAAALLARLDAAKVAERHVALAKDSAKGGLVHAQRHYPNLAGDFDLIGVRLNLALAAYRTPPEIA